MCEFGMVGRRIAGAILLVLLASCTGYAAYRVPAIPPPAPTHDLAQTLAPNDRAQLDALQAGDAAALVTDYLSFVQLHPATPVVGGNTVELLIDGPATMQAMFDAIEHAQHSIALQTYIFDSTELGQQMAERLMAKRDAGVAVRVLYDGIGSVASSVDFFARLADSGVAVCEFNPPNLSKGALSLNHRGHSKIMVIDEQVGFTGGINVSDVYKSSSASALSRPRHDPQTDSWRDTHVAIHGPGARQLLGAFERAWVEQRCPQNESTPPQAVRRTGQQLVQVLHSDPSRERNDIYVDTLVAVRSARRSIYITMGYFAPDQQTIEYLTDAAGRGVEVKLIVAGVSDAPLVVYAGRTYYEQLLRAGGQVYEREDALLHAKSIVIDGVWSMVGSANLDWRSFIHNDEVSAVVLDRDFGRQMVTMFADDLAKATPIMLEQWQQRGWWVRSKEQWARIWAYWF